MNAEGIRRLRDLCRQALALWPSEGDHDCQKHQVHSDELASYCGACDALAEAEEAQSLAACGVDLLQQAEMEDGIDHIRRAVAHEERFRKGRNAYGPVLEAAQAEVWR
jgi:hypothetical protein